MTVSQVAFAAIDFESAGAVRGATDVPVQIGIARMTGCGEIGDFFTSYLGTTQPILWSAQKVHGIRSADLAGAKPLIELWPEVKGLLEGRWMVAHGAGTEKRFLRAFPFHGFGPWVDTLRLSRVLTPGMTGYSLGELAGSYGLEEELRRMHEGFRWHDALSDAVASLAILRHLIKVAALGEHPAEELLEIR